MTAMTPWTLITIEHAVRGAWGPDTCDPVDLLDWHAGNPSRGQCGGTALVLHDLLGGEVMMGEVRFDDGRRQGVHYWNRLVGGVEVDLTREQFCPDERVGEGEPVVRPAGPPRRCREQYELLRTRVTAALDRSGTGGGIPGP